MNRSMALKEWAVVCEALAAGRQSVLFRTGGIHETAGGFHPEHSRFWLFPTGFHQSLDAIRPEYRDEARQRLESRPYRDGAIPIQHRATIEHVAWIQNEAQLTEFRDRHILADHVVRERFHYRRPGLYVLTVGIVSLAEPVWIRDLPEYAGCRSWVELRECLIPPPSPSAESTI